VPTTNFHVNNNVIINNVEVAPVNPDLEIAKQMIDLGITNVPKKLQKNQNNNTNDNYENVEPVNPDLEKAKQMIDLGITNVPKISDKDKNNKSNNMDNGLTQPMKLRKSVTNKVAPKSTLPKTPIKPKL
jgi:deoxycytidylate deaminase